MRELLTNDYLAFGRHHDHRSPSNDSSSSSPLDHLDRSLKRLKPKLEDEPIKEQKRDNKRRYVTPSSDVGAGIRKELNNILGTVCRNEYRSQSNNRSCPSPSGAHMQHGSHPSSMTSPLGAGLSHSPLVAHPPPATSSPHTMNHNVATSACNQLSKTQHGNAGQTMDASLMFGKPMMPNGLPPWSCNPMLMNVFSMYGSLPFPPHYAQTGPTPEQAAQLAGLMRQERPGQPNPYAFGLRGPDGLVGGHESPMPTGNGSTGKKDTSSSKMSDSSADDAERKDEHVTSQSEC